MSDRPIEVPPAPAEQPQTPPPTPEMPPPPIELPPLTNPEHTPDMPVQPQVV